MRFAVPLALLILTSAAAHARDLVDWSFEVLEVSPEGDGHLLRLRPLPPGRKFPRSCETFVVHAVYGLDGRSRVDGTRATRERHERSLTALRQAQATGDVLRFGAVGRGFAAIEDSPRCEVASYGLVYFIQQDGSSVVYSIFPRP